MPKVSRDTVKTVGGVVLIAVIVVGTFLYGNTQRQNQLRKDQTAKQTQTNQVTQNQGTGVAVTSESGNQTTNTPPTQSSQATQTSNQAAKTQSPGVGGGNLPANTPSTGGELGYLMPLALIIGLYQTYLYTKQLRDKNA